jgi:hypothetical protein
LAKVVVHRANLVARRAGAASDESVAIAVEEGLDRRAAGSYIAGRVGF